MNGNGEKIRKIVFDYGSFAVGVVALTVAVQSYFSKPQMETERELLRLKTEVETQTKLSKELDEIKNNHLHTIEQQLVEVANKVSKVEEAAIKTDKAIVRIETILEERLPK